jgi:hypothetical protein
MTTLSLLFFFLDDAVAYNQLVASERRVGTVSTTSNNERFSYLEFRMIYPNENEYDGVERAPHRDKSANFECGGRSCLLMH